ncbi:MAG: heparinase II/III family protein [Clostridia bacterium]|nr:heparinase II/III family protein [Clostridia bacterium]
MFLETVKDPAFWEGIRKSEAHRPLIEELVAVFEKDGLAPIVEMPYTMAQDFFVSGDREKGEEIYFQRRRALNACAILSLVYPEERKYFDRLQDIIFAICNEYTWELPAHIPNLTDYIPDDIDLFAAETGFALSEMYVVFGERFDPLIRTRIKMEVERRIINPFSNYDRKFPWINYHSNWAAVCASGVAASFMYLAPERFADVKPRIDEAMASFLRSYKDCGYCIEGLGYWKYGFGFYVSYAQMLYDFTGGKEDLFASEKIKAISTFPQKMFLSGQAVVSFSDGSMKGVISRGLCHYLAKKYPDVVFPYPQTDNVICDQQGRWAWGFRSFVWHDLSTEKMVDELLDYSPYIEWLVYRNPAFGFAAKGGCNREAHNHNDVGSFIFAVDGKQVFADVGAGLYTRQYFRDEYRYDYFHPSSCSHSVPILFGNYQKAGSKYRAENAVWDGKTFSFDYAAAYDDERVTSLKRAVTVEKSGVTIRNQITYAEGITPTLGDYTERYVLMTKPTIEDGKITAGGVVATYKGAGIPTVTEQKLMPRADIFLTDGDIAYLVDFAVEGTEFEIRIEPENK